MNPLTDNAGPPAWFPLFFIGMWLMVSFLISRMGWNEFAQRYPAAVRPAGRSFNCPNAYFGNPFASYRNVMRVTFTPAGIYFRAFILFRPFHPPFLVPWNAVKGLVTEKFLWSSFEVLQINDGTGQISIKLSDAAAKAFRNNQPGHRSEPGTPPLHA